MLKVSKSELFFQYLRVKVPDDENVLVNELKPDEVALISVCESLFTVMFIERFGVSDVAVASNTDVSEDVAFLVEKNAIYVKVVEKNSVSY